LETWILWKNDKIIRTLWNFGIHRNWPTKRICICHCTHMWIVHILGWGVWTWLLWFSWDNRKMLVFVNIDEVYQIKTSWSNNLQFSLYSWWYGRIRMNQDNWMFNLMNDVMWLVVRILWKMWFWTLCSLSWLLLMILLVILTWWFGDDSCWVMTCELWSEGVSFGDDYLMSVWWYIWLWFMMIIMMLMMNMLINY
jgi:hypothetical protein